MIFTGKKARMPGVGPGPIIKGVGRVCVLEVIGLLQMEVVEVEYLWLVSPERPKWHTKWGLKENTILTRCCHPTDAALL